MPRLQPISFFSRQIDVGNPRKRQNENEKPDNERQPVFADARRDFDIVGAPRRRFIPCRGGCGHMYSPLPVKVRNDADSDQSNQRGR